MLRGDITIEDSLPSLQHWIKPVYEGKISEFDHDVLGITINIPDDWINDFPNNNYKFSSLIKLLPSVVPINNNIAIKEAEMVDSSWLDFYELYNDLLSTFNKPKQNSSATKKPTLSKYMRFTDGKVLKSFHMNCTPSTLAALNHFVKTKLLTPWEWVATSTTALPPVNMPDKLDDPFGNDKQTGIFYGIDGDGDFTTLNNIRSLTVDVNLFTASIGSSNVQFLASIVCMAKTLLRDGTAIIQITDIKPLNVSTILILSSIFKKIELVQLSNLYIVGTKFKGITKTYLTRLTHILTFVKDITSSYMPGIFPRSEIPSQLIMKLSSIYPRLKPIPKPDTWIADLNIIDIKPHQKLF